MTTTTNGNGTTALARPAIDAAPAAMDRMMAFEPSNIEGALYLSKLLVASHLLPKAVNTPEAALAIIITGRELGLTAMQALRSMHIIEGKPTMSADLVAALVKSRPEVCEWFRLVESTDQGATYETKRKGEPASTRMSFTLADATRAGVTGKDNWRKYPSAMLRARCITALARAVYPDLVLGVYDPDELQADPAPVASPAAYEVVETTNDREQTVRFESPPAWRSPPIGATPKQGACGDPKQDADQGAPAATPPPAPASQPKGTFAALLDRVDAAQGNGDLNAVAAATKAAHAAGEVGDEQRATIAAAVRNKRAELRETTGEVQ